MYTTGILCEARVKNSSLELLFGFHYPNGKVGTKIYNLKWSVEKSSYYSAAYFSRKCLSKIIPRLNKTIPNAVIDAIIINLWTKINRDKIFCVNFSTKYKGGLHIVLTNKVNDTYDTEMAWPESVYKELLMLKGCSEKFIESISIAGPGKEGNFVRIVTENKGVDDHDKQIATLLLAFNGEVYNGGKDTDIFLRLNSSLDYNEFIAEYPNLNNKNILDKILETV